MPRQPAEQTPLYVRLPALSVEKLDRAAAALRVHKKDLVASLVDKYVNPDTKQGLRDLHAMATRPPPNGVSTDGAALVGSYSFQPYDPPEIMTEDQAAQFLQLGPHIVLELAEAGKLPGKRLGPAWRFSREALVAWLSTPEKQKR